MDKLIATGRQSPESKGRGRDGRVGDLPSNGAFLCLAGSDMLVRNRKVTATA